MDNLKTFFRHTFVLGPKGHVRRATFAGQFNPSNGELNINFSVCSKKDNFSKKIGRLIAEGRLNKEGEHPNTIFTLDDEQQKNPGKAFHTAVNELIDQSTQGKSEEGIKELARLREEFAKKREAKHSLNVS